MFERRLVDISGVLVRSRAGGAVTRWPSWSEASARMLLLLPLSLRLTTGPLVRIALDMVEERCMCWGPWGGDELHVGCDRTEEQGRAGGGHMRVIKAYICSTCLYARTDYGHTTIICPCKASTDTMTTHASCPQTR